MNRIKSKYFVIKNDMFITLETIEIDDLIRVDYIKTEDEKVTPGIYIVYYTVTSQRRMVTKELTIYKRNNPEVVSSESVGINNKHHFTNIVYKNLSEGVNLEERNFKISCYLTKNGEKVESVDIEYGISIFKPANAQEEEIDNSLSAHCESFINSTSESTEAFCGCINRSIYPEFNKQKLLHPNENEVEWFSLCKDKQQEQLFREMTDERYNEFNGEVIEDNKCPECPSLNKCDDSLKNIKIGIFSSIILTFILLLLK